MTVKKYLYFKLVIATILSGVISSSIVRGNYILPIVALIASVGFIYFAKKRVEGVVEDERDYKIAGKAARYSISIFGAISGIIVIVLFSLRGNNPTFEIIGSTLAYAVCGLLITSSLIFKYYQNKPID